MLPIADRLIQALEQLVILSDDVARATADYQAVLARQQADTARRAADTRREPGRGPGPWRTRRPRR